MRTWHEWDQVLRENASNLGFEEGYKFLYNPWVAIGTVDTVFLSLNPGRAPDGAELRTLSDERGNSYEVERAITASPITEQFLALCGALGHTPSEILTGVVAPFRSGAWDSLSKHQRTTSLQLGEAFWSEVFAMRRPRIVVACSPLAARMACRLLGATGEMAMPSGWGRAKLCRYRAEDGAAVVRLPHLSRYRLFSRLECQAPLASILRT